MKLRDGGRAATRVAVFMVLPCLMACHNAPRDDGSGDNTGNGDGSSLSVGVQVWDGGNGGGYFGPGCNGNSQVPWTPQADAYYRANGSPNLSGRR